MNLEAARPTSFTAQRALAACRAVQKQPDRADSFTIERRRQWHVIQRSTARCGANFILFSSADVVADSAYTPQGGRQLHRRDRAERDGFHRHGHGQHRQRTEAGRRARRGLWQSDAKRRGSQSFPDGEVPEMPSGERLQRAGEAPRRQRPSGRQYLRYHSNCLMAEKTETARAGRLLFAVCSVFTSSQNRRSRRRARHSSCKETTAGDGSQCLLQGKCPCSEAASAPAASGFSGVVD